MLVLVPWLVFLHTLCALAFFMAHGASVAMAFKIRSQTNIERIRAMLDLSGSTMMMMFVSFLGMGLTGLAMPFILRIWNRGWIWLSIVLMVAVFLHMAFMSERRYKHLRRLVGLPYMIGSREYPAEPPASQAEVEAHLKKMKVTDLVIVGLVIPTIVLWLMVFKPF